MKTKEIKKLIEELFKIDDSKANFYKSPASEREIEIIKLLNQEGVCNEEGIFIPGKYDKIIHTFYKI